MTYAQSLFQRVKPDLSAIAILLIATAFVFRRWLFLGRVLYFGDSSLYFFPQLRFERDSIAHGIVPLWNPHIISGTPFIGNPQMWPLYPSTVLLPLMPASIYLTIDCVLHCLLAGVFCFLFLTRRRESLSRSSSLLGATAYMFGGYIVSKAQYPNMVQAIAYIPLFLLSIDRLANYPAIRFGVMLGAAFGLQLLAAHAQISLYTIYLGTAYGLFQLRCSADTSTKAIKFLVATGAGILLAFGLSCGQWLSIICFRPLEARQNLSAVQVDRLHLSLQELSNYILPNRFGSPFHGQYIGSGAYWETACYSGLVPLCFALVGIITALGSESSRSRDVLFWLIVFVIGTWLALGNNGGLFPFVYRFIPGMKLFHDPARFLFGPALALPVLAAQGLQHIMDRKYISVRNSQILAAVVVSLTAFDLSLFSGNFYPLINAQSLEKLGANTVLGNLRIIDTINRADSGRILLADTFKANDALISWSGSVQTEAQTMAGWAQAGLPNLPMAMGLNDAGGYEPLALRDSGLASSIMSNLMQSIGTSYAENGKQTALVPDLLGYANVGDVISFRPVPIRPVPGLVLLSSVPLQDEYVSIYRNNDCRSRIRLASQWAPSENVSPIVRFLRCPIRGEQIQSNIRPLAARTNSKSTLAELSMNTVKIDQPDSDHVRVQVIGDRGPRMLIFSDTLFPGWRAHVNGKLSPIFSADGIYRAVYLPANQSPVTNTIEFDFKPTSYLVGLYVTLVTIMSFSIYFCFKGRALFFETWH